MFSNNWGYNSTAVGYQALYSTNGLTSFNTAIGANALHDNTQGLNNTSTGSGSMQLNTVGNVNTASGVLAMFNNIKGSNNVANGGFSLYNNNSGYSNVAIGINSLYSSTTKSNLVAIGDSALYNNGTGATLAVHSTLNTAVGSKVLYANTTGYYNTSMGFESLKNNNTGFYNTAVGTQALGLNTGGSENIAIGTSALYSNLSGIENTAVGYGTLYRNTSSSNTAIGYYTLGNNILGDANTGVGFQSMYNSNTGFQNTGVGYQALYNNNFNYNVAIGTQSLFNVNTTTAGFNVAVGSFAGYTQTNQNRCTFVGYGSDATGNFTNATALGFSASVNASNKVRIGSSAVTVVEGAASYTVSDGRFKTNVQDNVPGLDFINDLRPVTYQYQAFAFEKFLQQNNPTRLAALQQADYKEAENMIHMGLIAQDVEKLIKSKGYKLNVVHTPSNPTDNYSIAYAELVIPLIKAVQELNKKNDEQQKMIDDLLQRLKKLEPVNHKL